MTWPSTAPSPPPTPPAASPTPTPTTLSPPTGNVGTGVTLTGTGFSPNSAIPFQIDGSALGSGTISNSSGGFTATVTMPDKPRGDRLIKATDASGYYSPNVAFTVTSRMTMSPASGPANTQVTITGSGFDANAVITVTYNGSPVTTTPSGVTAGAGGSFSATFLVPSGLSGTFPVNVLSNGAVAGTANFTSTTDATINQQTTDAAPGYVGMTLTITGQGFKPNAAITATLASTPTVVGTTTSDASGNFTLTVTIPAVAHGGHPLTVSHGVISKTFPFVMESTPPNNPAPLVPKMLDKAPALAVFDWADVTDTSLPVTYELQVATDAAYTDILVDKKGLTTSTYTLTDAEKLKSTGKDAPYYWHVRAVDGAQNASSWTGNGTFYVGFILPELKGVLLYVVMGAIAVVFFFIGLLVAGAIRRAHYD